MNPKLTDLPPLFCKLSENEPPDQVVYATHIVPLNATISFRSLCLVADLPLIHDWVNRDYAKRFWQLEGSADFIHDVYSTILTQPHGHSFLGLLNEEPICQIDIYRVMADELARHLSASENDCGIHLLMAPIQRPIKGLTLATLSCFIDYYFSFPEAGNLYVDPDRENYSARQLASRAGFQYVKEVVLSYKTAHLYQQTREQFSYRLKNMKKDYK